MYDAWRAAVEKDLAGVAFDKALVHPTPEGLALQPLYVAASAASGEPGAPPYVRGREAAAAATAFALCVPAAAISPDDGADAVWTTGADTAAIAAAAARGLALIVDAPTADPLPPGARDAWLGCDPIADVAAGGDPAQLADLTGALAAAPRTAAHWLRVSGVAFHTAGADAADELALMLSTAVAYLRAADDPAIAGAMWAQVAIGDDTFGELCKLRALRACWHKLLVAAGAPDTTPPPVHAVCSPRTLAQRDPWVNLLRVTTQVFAAALGGAQRITPLAFDAALAAQGDLGRRLARTTALVLREESHLGRVADPAGGAYYLETRSDQLARAAWARFTALERDGGITPALASGALRDRLATAWTTRAAAIARRKQPVLGVSEFANLGEQLPAPPAPPPPIPPPPALVPHRDGEAFEALRARAAADAEVALVVLGPPAEHRARAGFATAVFALAGVRAREVAAADAGAVPLACLCGSDERYATEAAATARALRDAGCSRIAYAGRPGALEPALREAGVTTFLYLGCDVLAALAELVA